MSQALVTSMRARSQAIPQTRTVVLNHKEFPVDGSTIRDTKDIPDNRVVTSKYTLLNFLPKNLFEQFRRIANFYFLCIAVIQVTTNSPTSPVTSLAPLIFVVTTTALKQAYEDWLRHKTDKATNHRLFPVLVGDKIVKIRSEKIKVGDIVRVENKEEIPCDMVMISCDNKEGKCHVTTANLDGETNLKIRDCLQATRSYQTVEGLLSLIGFIECEKPNTDLYEYVGVMKLQEERRLITHPLGPTNLLVRGSRLLNSQYVYGVAVYTGQETKMALNSRLTSNKFSTLEKTVNRYLLVYLFLLCLASVTCTIFCSIYRDDPTIGQPWYIPEPNEQDRITSSRVFEEFLSFFVIYNYVIPISLYVTLEMVKFFGSKTLVNDPKLTGVNLEKPKCNSSDLNEELGQVEYLFSDKTGTLTENTMRFRSCSVGGQIYEEHEGKLMKKNIKLNSLEAFEGEMERFFLAIALCNTVHVAKKESESNDPHANDQYLADSPDEKALVEACQRFGVKLVFSDENSCEIAIGTRLRKFKKLQIFEFDPTRKRMSVIVQSEDGNISLICKGAESELQPLLISGNITETYQHVDSYAREGLRTLVISVRDLSKDDYTAIEKLVNRASETIENRKEAVMGAFIKVETKLKLLGATAVEDRLQDGVPETIHDLKIAGIKIWVLTGDKLETAVSVAFSCNLLDMDMNQLVLARQANSDSCGECINTYYNALHESVNNNRVIQNAKPNYAFIVDGRSLHIAMKFHLEKFKEICLMCSVVVCCRMSPIQKAEVVHMVKVSKRRPVTAAIGDGANDVSMIQEAHVGFGLMGKEGRQAVNSCDFAFARFKFVKRILLVHGNLFYRRVATLIHYFFYKNVIFVTPQFLYSFYNAFSSQTLYHGMLLMLYNMMFSASPILIYGIVERHLPIEKLEREPTLYSDIARNRKMRHIEFCKWFFVGVYHGLVIYYFYMFAWQNTSHFQEGEMLGVYAFGTCVYHGVVLTVTLKLALMTKFWTIFFAGSVALSFLSLPTFCALYSGFKWGVLNDDFYGIYYDLMLCPFHWLCMLIVPVIALLPDYLYIVVKNTIANANLKGYFDKRNSHVRPHPIERF